MDKLKIRKNTRLKGADYNRNQAIFLTLCTKERRCVLSHVVGTGVPDGPQIKLTGYGQIADKYLRKLNDFYDDLSVESYVIMPNHIHILLWVKGTKKDSSRTLKIGPPRMPEIGPSRTPEIGPSRTPEIGPSRTPEIEPSRSPEIGPSRSLEIGPSRTPEIGPSRTPVPTVQNSVPSRFVSTFKRFCNKEYGTNIWQYRSHDHIIRNREDYEEHLRYIYENPMRWNFDELYVED